MREQTAISVDTFASSLSDRVLHCRELGHSWRALTARWDPESQSYDRRLRCSQCRTVRVQLLTERGHVISNRYIYADGYLATNVDGRNDRDVFRRVALERLLSATARETIRIA